ncbi:MAG TPA: hypothetical protein VFE52_09910 [Devosia sp.]|jgi:hypothetical protein|nr:hypothetical protein [Devosia sp.]
MRRTLVGPLLRRKHAGPGLRGAPLETTGLSDADRYVPAASGNTHMRIRLAATALAATLAFAASAHAAGLSGMGAAIYGNSFNFSKANLQSAPVGTIKAGKLNVGLQTTRLADVRKAFGGTIQSDGEATWLCYHAGDTNTWFISNPFGGPEFVMMVAVEVNSKMPADCEASDSFTPPQFGVPTVGAKLAELKAHFGAASGSKVAYRADRAGGYSDIAQYLGYQLKGGTVTGIGVGETSIPTAH